MSKLLTRANAVFRLLGLDEVTIEDAKPVIDEVTRQHLWQLVNIRNNLEQCAKIAEHELWMIIQDEIKLINSKIDYVRGLKNE